MQENSENIKKWNGSDYYEKTDTNRYIDYWSYEFCGRRIQSAMQMIRMYV